MGPLARRSPWRLARSGAWGLLVAGAFLLLATAAAAGPIFAEATDNASLDDRLAAVPASAVAAEAPVVRVVGGLGAADQARLAKDLAGIPGLSPARSTAFSTGVESNPITRFDPFVSAGPGDARTARARIFADDDLAHSLVPAPGSKASAPASATGEAQVWLPAPVAATLKVAVGDQVHVGVQLRERSTRTPARVAGIYAVGPGGRLPADPPGVHEWSLRRAEVPTDSEFRTLPASLIVTDVATAARLAPAIGDELLFSVEARLQPHPRLNQARATAAAVLRSQDEVRDTGSSGSGPLDVDRHEQVISGLPSIVGDAGDVADRTRAWTSTAEAAALALGLLAVLAVSVFGLVRRAVELRLMLGLGVRPVAVAALAGVEVLPLALVCSAAGWLAGWGLVAVAGPPGAITEAGLRSAAERSLVAVAAGVLLVAAAALLAAVAAGRLTGLERVRRSTPWEPALLAIALTASAGLLLRPDDAGPPSALDLLVPVLVLAATGAVGGRLILLLAANRATGERSTTTAWARRPAVILAARRLSGGGRPAVLLITVLTVGFGFLIYSFAAAASVRQITGDRTAVLSGARATADVDASWLLDPGAARLPVTTPDDVPLPAHQPVNGVRIPPLPDGTTIVWRSRITMPPEYDTIDLLVIDPRRFAEVAGWGTGPELARARHLVSTMGATDARVTAQLAAGGTDSPIPALTVGPVSAGRGDTASIATLAHGEVPIRVLDAVPAFPGYGGNLPMIVVPADSFFGYLGPGDPRIQPPLRQSQFDHPTEFSPSLWSSAGLSALQAYLDPRGIEQSHPTTSEQAAQDPAIVAARRAIGFQLALGLCVAGLGVLGLAMFADRAAGRARAADLMLVRMGMGRRGVGRARALELGAFAVIALVLAGVGTLLILPMGARLLDPGGGPAPAFVLRLDRLSLEVTALTAVAALLSGLLVSRSALPSGSGRSAGEVLRDVE